MPIHGLFRVVNNSPTSWFRGIRAAFSKPHLGFVHKLPDPLAATLCAEPQHDCCHTFCNESSISKLFGVFDDKWKGPTWSTNQNNAWIQGNNLVSFAIHALPDNQFHHRQVFERFAGRQVSEPTRPPAAPVIVPMVACSQSPFLAYVLFAVAFQGVKKTGVVGAVSKHPRLSRLDPMLLDDPCLISEVRSPRLLRHHQQANRLPWLPPRVGLLFQHPRRGTGDRAFFLFRAHSTSTVAGPCAELHAARHRFAGARRVLVFSIILTKVAITSTCSVRALSRLRRWSGSNPWSTEPRIASGTIEDADVPMAVAHVRSPMARNQDRVMISFDGTQDHLQPTPTPERTRVPAFVTRPSFPLQNDEKTTGGGGARGRTIELDAGEAPPLLR